MDFNERIRREGTRSEKWDGLEKVFGQADALPLWVADMDFPCPPEVTEALVERARHGVFGYTMWTDSYYRAASEWLLRRHGWRAAMAEAGLPVPDGYEQRGDYLLRTAQSLCATLCDLPEPPTAIFCANDEMAFGAIHELRRSGLDVPRDVSVVGFDDIYLSQAIYPPLTTVSQPRAGIGRMAMTVLLDIMAGGKPPDGPVMMPTTLMLRESTAPAKQPEPLRG